MPARVAAKDTGVQPSAAKTDINKETPAESEKPGSSEIQEQGSAPRNQLKLVPARTEIGPLSSFEFWLSVIILGFTLIIMIGEVVLIISGKITATAEAAVRFVLVTLIIGATMFLIASGYSNDQIAPAMGLFGTIAGYLLGKSTGKTENG